MFSLPIRYEHIREIPYPYKGMMALSSDAEYTSFEILEFLIKFLNTNDKTPFGYGLGLKTSFSIFFYSDNPLHTSMYNSLKLNSKETKHAESLRSFIKEGYIDTNHAYGDFNIENNFTREHALKVYEMLERYSLTIPIYTNHGNGVEEAMRHNVGFLSYHQGSDQDSPFYHMDLFSRNGGRYIWTDDWVFEKKPYISLDGKCFMSEDGRQLGGVDKIIQRLHCKDGEYYFFKRYRSTRNIAPTFQTFNYQIESIDWEEFYRQSSVAVIYQHFGSFYVAEKNLPTSLELLKKFPYYLQGFYFLKQEQDKGNLLVRPTWDLLRYCEMYFSTKVDVEITDKEEIYSLTNYQDICNLDFFRDLTIYIQNPRKTIKVIYKDKILDYVRNGLDRRAKYSISILGEQL